LCGKIGATALALLGLTASRLADKIVLKNLELLYWMKYSTVYHA